jgi:hypothetical protein
MPRSLFKLKFEILADETSNQLYYNLLIGYFILNIMIYKDLTIYFTIRKCYNPIQLTKQ